MNKPSIGFIGLGLMGSAMVGRMQSLGYQMTVIANRSRSNVEAAVARGATELATSREIAAASDIVMLCMDTSASVESRMFGEDGVIAGLKKGTIVIDFGTSLPGSTRTIGEAVAEAECTYLDAPLGRTPSHAIDGQLNIMAAGNKAAYDKIKPILDDLGENVFHLGDLGTGHTIKLINNFFAQTVATAMSEAFAIADVAGVDRQKLYDVMSAGPLKSGMMDFIKANAIDGNPNMLAFSINNAAKDVGYYSRMVEDFGAVSLMSAGTKSALELAKSHNYGDRMVPELVEFISDLNKPK